jgi:hypothetical protein
MSVPCAGLAVQRASGAAKTPRRSGCDVHRI